MDLLDRYLQAVRFWLPKNRREDIAAELADDLQAQVDDMQEGLGRPVTDDELETVLRRYGHPIVVAERFAIGPNRTMIGPELFPIYRMLLKGFWLFYLLPWLAIWLICLCIPAFRTAHPRRELVGTFFPWWSLAVHSFAFLTLGFAILDRVPAKAHWFESWSLRSLPAPADPYRISRSSAFGDLMSFVTAAVLWIMLPQYPGVYIQANGVLWTPGAVWQTLHHTLFAPILIIVFADLALAAANLFMPIWTRGKALMRAGTAALAMVIDIVVLCIHAPDVGSEWVRVASSATASDAAKANAWTDVVVYACVVVAALISAGYCLWYARKALKLKPAL